MFSSVNKKVQPSRCGMIAWLISQDCLCALAMSGCTHKNLGSFCFAAGFTPAHVLVIGKGGEAAKDPNESEYFVGIYWSVDR